MRSRSEETAVRMSSVCHLQLHHTLPSVPVNPRAVVHPSGLSVHVDVTLRGCREASR